MTKARLWVVCPSCDQWNLVPIEERLDALDECERLAESAEVRANAEGVGFARTTNGLELLRAAGISDADIANARYGRGIRWRQRLLELTFVAVGLLAVALGILATIYAGSLFGVYIGLTAGSVLFHFWRHPPRRWIRVRTPEGRRMIVWPWQVRSVRLETPAQDKPPVLVVPRFRADLHLRDDEAVAVLAGLLPRLNGADCMDASVGQAINYVEEAEAACRRAAREVQGLSSRKKRKKAQPCLRPWQKLAMSCSNRSLDAVKPEYRLALEMAVMEDLEQRELSHYAKSIGQEWDVEEEIASIADGLLIPSQVEERLALLKQARSAGQAS